LFQQCLDFIFQVDIFREKAVRYEEQLLEVKAILRGNRPQQIRFRSGGTLCTFSCSSREEGEVDGTARGTATRGSRLPHTAGTDTGCKTCSSYMLHKILEVIDGFSAMD